MPLESRTARFCLVAFVALALMATPGCSHDDAAKPSSKPDTGACATLFGIPNDKTGLAPDSCRPECSCGDSVFAPPTYDAAFIGSLVTGWTLSTPFAPLSEDPYMSAPPPNDSPGTVCAVVPEGAATDQPRRYHLTTFDSEQQARSASATPTHSGHCGVCSTLANLAVYMKVSDLTAPVRECGLIGISDGGAADVSCLEALGFDLPCAQAWYYDTLHTRTVCLNQCLTELDKPYHLPDGALNPCLQCDEDQSGPVFKAVAGRTRRNSGLPNALCRPCSDVVRIVHAY